MRVILAMTAWMLSVVSSYSYSVNSLPDINNETFIKDCVHVHNKLRSEVKPAASDMLYMTWDPALAQIARAWARKCQFSHNTQLKPPHRLHQNFTSLGENLWSGSLSIFSVSSAITNWYSEVQYYDFKTRKCNKVCGHYTQVVWADSYKVGCAVHFCPTVEGLTFPNAAHFICNYGPAGNYPTWPYKKGPTCSACPQNDNCLDNLCDTVGSFNKYPSGPNQDDFAKCAGHTGWYTRFQCMANPQRDKLTRYYSIVYPDWPIYSRNKHLSLFLAVSPPILILSATITILVKYKYLI